MKCESKKTTFSFPIMLTLDVDDGSNLSLKPSFMVTVSVTILLPESSENTLSRLYTKVHTNNVPIYKHVVRS